MHVHLAVRIGQTDLIVQKVIPVQQYDNWYGRCIADIDILAWMSCYTDIADTPVTFTAFLGQSNHWPVLAWPSL